MESVAKLVPVGLADQFGWEEEPGGGSTILL